MSSIMFNRRNARQLSAEFPIGDPFGGPAYGKREDVRSIVGPIVGGLMGSSAADTQASAAQSAAQQSADASKYATDLQRDIYQQTRADQAPWRAIGTGGLNMLADLMGINVPVNQQYGSNYNDLQNQYNNALTTYNKLLSSSGPSTSSYITNSRLSPEIQARIISQINGGTGYSNNIYNPEALNAAKANLDSIKAQIDQLQTTTPQYQPRSANFGSLMQDFGMKDFQADPGYAFRLSEGMKALDRSAAARGGLLSGATLKGAERYGQDMASQEYQNAFNRYQTNQANKYNRLSNIAGLGQTANNALQSAGSNYASNSGNLAMTNAANQGNALLAAGNARSSAYQGLGNAIGGIDFNKIFNPSSTSATTYQNMGSYSWNPEAYTLA